MSKTNKRILSLLNRLYDAPQAQSSYARLMAMLDEMPLPQISREPLFSERDRILITYGDTLQATGEPPLVTLRNFVNSHMRDAVSAVHILPFYPYSSDDGFSVIDYYAVNPELGTWEHVRGIGEYFQLMFDAVINHMSAKSEWFAAFLNGTPGFRNMFVTESPQTDLSAVTRPRTSPLLTKFQRTDLKTIYVWTTFSADQVDLNFKDPDTLLHILHVLLFYVSKGAQILRLDAIAFAWKEVGTTSLHLPEVHMLVQLIRAVFDHAAPHVILITETNVPHKENISYFGDGTNEAQLVYNFTLPPLLLHTMLSKHADKLAEWVNTLSTPSTRTTFFNFTASHDGIGVRPVEGILNADELQKIIAHVESQGGRISYRNNPDGSRSPYELNITYLDAVTLKDQPIDQQVNRFMVTQGIMLALAGVPGIYIHSLLGSRNNIEGMQQTGHNRTINRAKLELKTVERELSDQNNLRARVFRAYTHLLNVRANHRAFHPNGAQQAYTMNEGKVFALERIATDGSEKILALFNITDQPQQITLPAPVQSDIITGETIEGTALELAPYQMRWLLPNTSS